MKQRCYLKSNKHYNAYGERGIEICNNWLSDFASFYNWAINNGYSDNLSIDRIDVNGNYEPNNCRWADNITQMNNRRNNVFITFNNQTKTMSEWCRYFKIPRSTVSNRLKRGLKIENAFQCP